AIAGALCFYPPHPTPDFVSDTRRHHASEMCCGGNGVVKKRRAIIRTLNGSVMPPRVLMEAFHISHRRNANLGHVFFHIAPPHIHRTLHNIVSSRRWNFAAASAVK